MKVMTGTLLPGVFAASVVAGPFFALMTTLATLYLRLPRPIVMDPQDIGLAAMIFFPTLLVGFVVGLPINALGGNLMALIGRYVSAARSKRAWVLVGGAIGLGFAVATGMKDSPEAAFGLVATSAICAGFCSRWVEWDDEV